MVGFATKPGWAGRIAAALMLAALWGWHPAPAMASPLLAVTPSPVSAGGSVTVTLTDSVAGSAFVGGIDLEFNFDPSVISFVSIANGAALVAAGWGMPVFNEPTPGLGLVSISECDFSVPSCGSDLDTTDGALLVFDFDVLPTAASGSSTITAGTQADVAGIEGEYQLSPTSATFSVTAPTHPVPAPGASALLLPGLALIGLVAGRRRRLAE
jgi:hypothetical protein